MATTVKTVTNTAQVFQIDPFDIVMHATESGVRTLQSRISGWLSTLNSPARFISYQLPATLEPKISQVKSQIAHLGETDPANNRVELLGEYRRLSTLLMLYDLME